MKIEDIDFATRTIFIPDSKTPTGRRFVPMSDRVVKILTFVAARNGRGGSSRHQSGAA